MRRATLTLLSFDMSIIVLEVLAVGIKKEKEINVIHIDGGKKKNSLFEYGVSSI